MLFTGQSIRTVSRFSATPLGFFAGFIVILGGPTLGYSQAVDAPEIAAPAADISPLTDGDAFSRLQTDMFYLADDERTGRGPGTPGLDQAAEYIANVFRDAGLKTDLIDGQPFQPFQIELGAEATDEANNYVLVTDSKGPPQRYALDVGMRPLALGASGEANGRLVFVGYGISAPELNYDDFAGVDIEGAIVMLIRKAPTTPDKKGPFDAKQNARHTYFSTKVQAAVQRGAAGVLIVNDPASGAAQRRRLQQRVAAEQERIDTIDKNIADAPAGLTKVISRLQETREVSVKQIKQLETELALAENALLQVGEAGGLKDPVSAPVISFSRKAASQMLKESLGSDLETIEQEIGSTHQPQSREIPDLELKVKTEIRDSKITTSNVLATLPGRGPLANETVVIGAHYDHVGMGGNGSLAPGTIAVHNGADDNGSGTVTLLEVARRMRAEFAESESHRRILFIAFSGEERGLLGSKFYIANPVFPLQDTVAMINLDMVGRLKDNEVTVYGTGTAMEFDGLLDRINEKSQFNLTRVASGYGPSDHSSFYQAKIPVLFYFTGLHNDYHRPSDDFDKIDFGGLVRITDTVLSTAKFLATGTRPTYQSTEPGAKITRQLTVHLGIRMQNGDNFVRIAEVAPSSPAERAGLRSGDIVTQMDGKPIKHSDEILAALRNKNPADLMTVAVKRGADVQKFRVLLGQRE
ncbi:M28 family peptidase [Roseimaritima multifibrata]|uniref:M28 family peptidase n=1 Tax=Roseimaritima multifibrata TaxID=1930274 RepID=UPI001C54EDDF|nr:M28 family peptidase [Roseimaritima multifibrata]